MLPLAPLFSIYRGNREQLCLCGELAVASSDGQVHGSGEGRSGTLAPALLDPLLLAVTAPAGALEPPPPLASRASAPDVVRAGVAAATPALLERFADRLAAELGQALELVSDGEGSLTPVLDASSAAALYRALAAAPASSRLGRVREALLAQPEWLDPADDVAARLMRANPGRLIARLGGDGWLALAVPRGAGAGVGVAVKLASGDQPEWAALAVRPFLEELGLTPLPAPASEVRWHVRPGRLRRAPLDVSPLLSDRIAVWPGDTPFRRVTSVEPGSPGSAGDAWSLVVSSIHTSLHVGAHVDAPNHVGAESTGIDRVPLDTYRGLCQVIRVPGPKRSVLTPHDLDERAPLAPRVLFATGSYRDPERFDPEFSALSPELIDWLEGHGAVLVGIDTPSIDVLSASDLASHRATRHGRGLAILEGLVLDGVEPGLYELIALPLRIEGADGSPVRATLWPLR
jgi:arylformamidase